MSTLFLPSLFGDYAVFAMGEPICVFGNADTEGDVAFTLADGTHYAAHFVPVDGAFSVLLPAVDRYTENATLTVTAGDASFTASHIAVGIVLLAAGQSNMELALMHVERPFAPYATDKLRFFTEKNALDAERGVIAKPASDAWYTANGETEMHFSAVGYLTSEILSRTLGVTVGVVSCNQGASRIEAWMSPAACERSGVDLTRPYYANQNYVFNKDHWLYFHKCLNVARYRYTAVLWYQGESNTGFGEGENYRRLFHEMIAERRKDNENPRLPFYLVELAPFDSVKAGWAPEPIGEIAPIREALVDAARTETDVYTVSLTPVPDVAEIHPVNKAAVAEKLANAILATLYGKAVEYTGPTFLSAEREGDTLTISFTHADGLCLLDGDCLTDAYFLSENGENIAAEGEIVGDRLVLSIPDHAKELRLGYCNAPSHNLVNAAGYLASPFRLSIPNDERSIR